MTKHYTDVHAFFRDISQQLLVAGNSIISSNIHNKDSIKEELVELSHQHFSIKNPAATVFNYDGFKTVPWWLVGEFLTEFLNENPPFMTRYRKDLIDLSYKLMDDGTTEYSYGSRWKEFNQIDNVVKKLKSNPTSKRCLITTWMPYDSDVNRNDVPCFPGNTEILSPEGDITIEKLFKLIKKRKKYSIFSMNNQNKQVEIKNVINSFNKGKKQLFRVYFDDKSWIDATEDHEFYIKKNAGKNYEKIRLKDLKIGDRIVPFTIFVSPKGLAFIKNLKESWKLSNQQNIKNNHKIIKIMKLNKKLVVYDIEVEDNHNFFVKFNNLNNKEYKKLRHKNIFSYQIGCLVSNCNINYMFLPRDGKLDMTATIRSNDIMRGTKYDYPLAGFMQQSIAALSGLEVGELYFLINSLHVYKKDLPQLLQARNESRDYTKKAVILKLEDKMDMDKYYFDLRHIKKAEEASYNSAFEYANKHINDMNYSIFKDMARIITIRNAKFVNNLEWVNNYTTQIESEEMKKWIK
jgi:thymidylate synthase